MNTEITGIIVLVAFVASFTAITVWAYWPSNKAKLQAHASIPLNEEDTPNGQ